MGTVKPGQFTPRGDTDRRRSRRTVPLTRPSVIGFSMDRDEMLKFANKCRNTKRHAMVRMVPRRIWIPPLKFTTYFVLCWPKDDKVVVEEVV